LAAAVICTEAMRRLGQPSGVSRDLLSAWWLPIALLLPPLYALLAPFAVGAVLYARTRHVPVYRRVFRSAALALAGAAASVTFHPAPPRRVVPPPAPGGRGVAARPAGGADRGHLRGRVRGGELVHHRSRRAPGRTRRAAQEDALGPGNPAARPDRDLRR